MWGGGEGYREGWTIHGVLAFGSIQYVYLSKTYRYISRVACSWYDPESILTESRSLANLARHLQAS